MAPIHELHRTKFPMSNGDKQHTTHYLDFSLHYFQEDLSARQTHIWEWTFHMMMMAVKSCCCLPDGLVVLWAPWVITVEVRGWNLRLQLLWRKCLKRHRNLSRQTSGTFPTMKCTLWQYCSHRRWQSLASLNESNIPSVFVVIVKVHVFFN